MAHHQFFEWESRPFEGDHAIPLADAEQLVRVAEAQAARLKGRPKAFAFHRHSLATRNLVGLISVGDTSCEILPKVDRDASGDATSLRHQLIQMLGVVYDLRLADDSAAAAGMQDRTLLEFLIRRFTEMLETQVRRGLPRAYVAHADDLPSIRGQLDVSRQFSTLAARPHQLACRYDEFSVEVAINHAMKAAVRQLHRVSRSLDTRRRLGELALMYVDVVDVLPREIAWETITRGRGTANWLPLVRFAKLLLGQRFQSTSHGRDEVFSLLFDMNDLFERYVERMIGPIVRELGLSVSSQGGKQSCLLAEDDGSGLFETIPDLRLCRGQDTELIIDTKWKRLSDRSVDAKMGISQSDVYQMMAYSQVYRCGHVILLYPAHDGLIRREPIHHRLAVHDGDVRLSVATVDIRSHMDARASLWSLLGQHSPKNTYIDSST